MPVKLVYTLLSARASVVAGSRSGVKVDNKFFEIAITPELLKLLEITGASLQSMRWEPEGDRQHH